MQVPKFTLAGEEFHDFVIEQTIGDGALQLGADGLVGYQFLNLFDWYFDEAGGAAYAIPTPALQAL